MCHELSATMLISRKQWSRKHARLIPFDLNWISKFSSRFHSITLPNCEMGHNRRFLKVISIVQIVMSAIFLALGITDRYEVRIIFSSYLFTPCWIAALVSTSGLTFPITNKKFQVISGCWYSNMYYSKQSPFNNDGAEWSIAHCLLFTFVLARQRRR